MHSIIAQTITIDIESVKNVAGLITAVITIGTFAYAIFKWFEKQKKQDIDIAAIKEEQCLLTYGILACLKGLREQGCNGPVKEAVDKIEKHLNQKAHDQ